MATVNIIWGDDSLEEVRVQDVGPYLELGSGVNRNCAMGINCSAELATADLDTTVKNNDEGTG